MIRRVKDEDVLRLLNIFNYYVRETEITLELNELEPKEYLERMHQVTSFYPWIVYEEEGIVWGFAYLDRFNYRKAYQTTADLTIYVDPECKRMGIGSKLYEEIEKLALSLGICKIVSLITASNRASISFHRKHNFRYCTKLNHVAYKHGKWVGVTIMEHDIQSITHPVIK